MSLIPRALPIVLFHDLVEVASGVLASLVLKLLKETSELQLYLSGLLLELGRAVPHPGGQRHVFFRPASIYVVGGNHFLLLVFVHFDGLPGGGCENSLFRLGLIGGKSRLLI